MRNDEMYNEDSDALLPKLTTIEELRAALLDKLMDEDPTEVAQLLNDLLPIAAGNQEWSGVPSIRLMAQMSLVSINLTCKEQERIQQQLTPMEN